MNWERVYTVGDYHDGPLSGIADYHGSPHAFEAEFSEADDEYSGRYWLMPIDREVFELAIQFREIGQRWKAAWKAGETSIDTFPLPDDKKRSDELKQAIGDRLTAGPEKSVWKSARFRRTGEDEWEVAWIDEPSSKVPPT
jgi:hypothetical protein